VGTFRLALISMPWPLANRPSLQLATLKSFLREKAPEVETDCYHPYLQVGNLLGIQAYNNGGGYLRLSLESEEKG